MYSAEVQPLPDLSIRQLEYLVAVAEEPTWAVAAERVGVSASALSQGLAELERRLGVALFDRDGRRRLVRTERSSGGRACPPGSGPHQRPRRMGRAASYRPQWRTPAGDDRRSSCCPLSGSTAQVPRRSSRRRPSTPRLAVRPARRTPRGRPTRFGGVCRTANAGDRDRHRVAAHRGARRLRSARPPHRPTLDVGAVGAVPHRLTHAHRRGRRAATTRRPDRRGRREPPARGVARDGPVGRRLDGAADGAGRTG